MATNTSQPSVGDVVLRARVRAGLTQAQLAVLSGIKYRTSINHIERGRWNPSVALLARLLDACQRASHG